MNEQKLARLNALDETATRDEFSRCCGAQKWVEEIVNARPFANENALFEAAEHAFSSLKNEDWLEAFSHHPQIGDLESLRAKFTATRNWAGNEQAGTSVASDEVLHALAEGNRLYLEKFGFIFIICATGKSAEEMLMSLRERLPNSFETELKNAAEQQRQITCLRLQKLLETL